MQSVRSGIAAWLRRVRGGMFPATYDDAVLLVARVLFAGMLIVLVADECAFRTAGPYTAWHALFSIGEVAVLLLAIWRPTIGGWAIVVLGQTGGLVPFGASPVLLSACLCAAAVLGFRSMAQGLAGVAICCGEYIAVNSPLMGNRLVPMNAALFTATVLICALAGALLHRVLGDLAAKQQADQRRKREQLAFALHNETCNDVAYLIRRIDEIQATSRQVSDHDVAELRSILEAVLAQTRAVVSVMTNDGEQETRSGVAVESVGRHRGEQLRPITEQYEQRLRRLGFQGEIIVEIAHDVSLDSGSYGLITDMLGELFADIVKHADPQGGYFITLGLSSARFSLSACDKPRCCGHTEKPTGMGLRRHVDRIESSGGSIAVQCAEDRWMVDIDLPL